MDTIDAQWHDIWDAVTHSGLATWEDWIDLGQPDPWPKEYDPWRDA